MHHPKKLYDKSLLFDHFQSNSLDPTSSKRKSQSSEHLDLILQASLNQLSRILKKKYFSSASSSSLIASGSQQHHGEFTNQKHGDLTTQKWLTGPQVVEYVTNQLIFPQCLNCSLVHLAARYNKVDILHWLQSCCCDEKCSHHHLNNSNSLSLLSSLQNSSQEESHLNDARCQSQHSKECLLRQEHLWSLHDLNNATPLFYACLGSKTSDLSNVNCSDHSLNALDPAQTNQNSSGLQNMDMAIADHESVVFLLSQPIVKEKQLNYHLDSHGNQPIVIALRKRDYALCDLLILFGATLNVTVGLGIGISESLLHFAMRERDLKLVRYIGSQSQKTILKRNQRDENALFACLRDFRSNQHNSSGRVNSNLSMHAEFFKEILQQGPSIFGNEHFHKALLLKNSFGRNLLHEAIVLNDLECMKALCHYLVLSNQQVSSNSSTPVSHFSPSEFSDSSLSLNTNSSSSIQSISPKLGATINKGRSPRPNQSSPNLLEAMTFDMDKQGNTILHSMTLSVIMNTSSPLDDFMWLFDGLRWILSWMENTFKPSLLDSPSSSHPPISNFALNVRNQEHFTIIDLVHQARKNSNDKSDWALSVLSEKLKETFKKWKEMDSSVCYQTGVDQEESDHSTISYSVLSTVSSSSSMMMNVAGNGSLSALSMSDSNLPSVSTSSNVNHHTSENRMGSPLGSKKSFLEFFKKFKKPKHVMPASTPSSNDE
ncbi:hypothetical protein FDP41_008104 [Naegleria fowleri]|uniref:Uncharacterized protein n=1 Tax=Naegleria fowleri TaxID=5763 RepID=A0A6A5BHC4_NAEFO|nr:uncharacterized protein FDP41_008104 [Naegleria fowleri]KAF0973400.1 hypothetical protein FDP41_008104 [Naegleria fowleri]